MNHEIEESIKRFTAWKKRTNRLYRPDDTGGRPTPKSVIDAMRRKPYTSGYTAEPRDEQDDTDNESAAIQESVDGESATSQEDA